MGPIRLPTPGSAFLVFLTFSVASLSFAEGNVNTVPGLRNLDDKFWEPVDDPLVAAVNVDFGDEGWPIHLVTGLSYAQSDDKPLLFGVQTAEVKLW